MLLPPQLENQSGSWIIENLFEEKHIFVMSRCQHLKTWHVGKRMMLCDIHDGMWQKEALVIYGEGDFRFWLCHKTFVLCLTCSLKPSQRWLTSTWTLIDRLYEICDRPNIMVRKTECYCGVFIPLFTTSVLAPIILPWLWGIVRSVWCCLFLHLVL